MAMWKPAPELGVVGERAQARARLGRQLGGRRVEQVGVRGDVGASDAAADLVELGEPESVGTLDDQRVCLGDVDAGLDDRGRDEHVGVTGDERVHALLELALAHLAVGDEEAQPGAELLQLDLHLVDRLDAVVQVERLPAASMLALECDANELLVVLGNGRADRPPALGRASR